MNTAKSCHYEPRNNDMPWKYNIIIDDAVMQASIEKSPYTYM